MHTQTQPYAHAHTHSLKRIQIFYFIFCLLHKETFVVLICNQFHLSSFASHFFIRCAFSFTRFSFLSFSYFIAVYTLRQISGKKIRTSIIHKKIGLFYSLSFIIYFPFRQNNTKERDGGMRMRTGKIDGKKKNAKKKFWSSSRQTNEIVLFCRTFK